MEVAPYSGAPGFTPDIDVVYYENEAVYRARVLSHGREYALERGNLRDLYTDLEHSLNYEYELLMRYIDPEGIARQGMSESISLGASSARGHGVIDWDDFAMAALGVNAALGLIIPSPGLIKDALHVARHFGGSRTARRRAHRSAVIRGGFSKKTKYAAVIGGVTIVARSRRELKKKMIRRRNHQIQLIMNAVRTHDVQRLKDRSYKSDRELYRRRNRDLPSLDDNIDAARDGNKTGQDWRSRAKGHRMRLIDKKAAALGLY